MEPVINPRVARAAASLLVVWRKLVESHEVTPFTLAMAVLALLSITVGTLYQKRHVQPCDVRTANCVQLMAAGFITLPFALMESDPVRAQIWSVIEDTILPLFPA